MTASIALVGAGPRAVAVAARLVADHRVLTAQRRLTVALIDPYDIGAGRTWRRDQHPLLLNNTYSAETTVFADASVPTVGATETGPSLAEWAQLVTADPDGYPGWVVADARQTQPWSFPTRRLQGAYFRWSLDRVIAAAAPVVDFVEHRTTAVGLTGDAGSRQRLTLGNKDTLLVDLVILTQGLLTSEPDDQLTDSAAEHGLDYLPAGMPTEQDWDVLPAGRPVIIRGLGANFFDVLGLLFEGRGGEFIRTGGELRYRPSGREPQVFAGSRHGLPYRAKAAHRGGPPDPLELPRFSAGREQQLIRDHGGRADVDFGRDLAAELAADLRDVHGIVAARRSASGRSSFDEPAFDWERIVFPADREEFSSETAWQRFLDGYFEAELSRTRDPDASPEKAVHRAVETARRRLSRLVLAGVFDPVSVVRDLKQSLLPQSLVLASGPPPERLEQLVALRRAGLVELMGPGLVVDVTRDGFRARSRVPGQSRRTVALAEARMRLGDLRRTDDPLVTSLLTGGQARFHLARNGSGATAETSTLDVTHDHFLLIDAAGRPHPRRIVLGSPAGDVQWNAAIGAIPHTSDKFLVGAERAAAYALGLIAQTRDEP